MKKIMFLCGLFVILALSSLYADGPMFNQPYDTTSPNLYTSTYDSTFPIDYRVADNFNGLTKPISKIVFYGSPIIYGGGAWTPSTFAATESFTIRFYNFVDLGTEPAWAAPVASYIVTATATYLENVTWAAYGIYKFEANLPAPFDLASGWISVQLNELTSSGAWYLTVESATGDDVSYQYEGAKSNSETAGVHSPALDSPKAVLASDMAFELYGADESIIIDGITAPPVGVTVIPGGESGMPGTDGGMAAVVYTITTTGVWDVIVHRPAGYPLPWYAYLNTVPMLESGPIMVDTFTFNDVDFGLVKGPIIVTLDDDEDLTLPVTLSSFTANLTAQNYVKLTW
ncbi:MAG: hypothetical protein PHO32_07285, partial [Candidatus Cloacimonetes bacterium]|nr:hypothetical protein [Candidatus Cloacimonadota bacterium]